jgi:uncharacterized membrane protein YjjP (DUF1212 family)/uncharacterized membrane protein YjjB (DUF3815 family)
VDLRSRHLLRTLGRAVSAGLLKPSGRVAEREDRPTTPDPDPEAVAMLTAFGVSMLQAAEPTSDVKATLERIAQAYGVDRLTVMVLPTMVMVQTTGPVDRIRIENVDTTVVRLDQAAAISTLAGKAVTGTLEPRGAVHELDRIRRSEPRFGPVVTVLGHGVLSAGFGLTLHPSAAAVPAYALLGLVVGAFVLAARRIPTLASAAPVAAAFLVTVLTTRLLPSGIGDDPFRVIAPPLITFLPGLTLTVAAVELTSNQVVAGASRVVYGIAQLLLLAFGVFAGLQLFPATATVSARGADLLPGWSTWVGVSLVAVGFVLFQSAPSRSLPWITASLLVAFGAQHLGARFLGADLSGFVGAVVVVPFTRVAARFRGAPPERVLMLVSFWFLVPGALGFVGVNELVTGDERSLQTVLSTGLSLFSVAIGFLVASGLSRDLASLRRQLPRGRQ